MKPDLASVKEVVLAGVPRGTARQSLKSDFAEGRGMFRRLAPAFMISGSRGEERGTIADAIIEKWSSAMPQEKRFRDPQLAKLLTASPNVVILSVRDRTPGGGGAIFRIPLDEESCERCRTNLEVLADLRERGGVMARHVPAPLWKGDFRRLSYYVEEEIDGIVVHPKNGRFRSISVRAAELLNDFHMETSSRVIVDEEFLVEKILFGLDERFDLGRDDERRTLNRRIVSYLRSRFLGRDIPLVDTHGDYKIENILVDPNHGEIRGVIDWDLSRRGSLPMLDLLHLILYNRSLETGTDISTLIGEVLIPGKLRGWEVEAVNGYQASLGIKDEELRSFSVAYWLHHVFVRLAPTLHLSAAMADYCYWRILRKVSACLD
jgi:hypothetical protein